MGGAGLAVLAGVAVLLTNVGGSPPQTPASSAPPASTSPLASTSAPIAVPTSVPAGPTPTSSDPDAVIAALDQAGVDYTLPRTDLVDFLNNPEYTPYPAIATGVLNMLGDRSLRRPLPIDFIVYYYENSPGNPSPRRIEDVDVALLKSVMVHAFNDRYDEQNTDFQSLLK
jgi:hypothetical protein